MAKKPVKPVKKLPPWMREELPPEEMIPPKKKSKKKAPKRK